LLLCVFCDYANKKIIISRKKDREMTLSLKQQWDSIPEDIRTKFAPRIKQGVTDFWKNAAQCDNEGWSEDKTKAEGEKLMRESAALIAEFRAAGGTEEQWSTIAYAVAYGKYDKLQAKP
jgi:hypothetical protein